MAGKILIDTNVLLDYLLEREPFFEDAKKVVLRMKNFLILRIAYKWNVQRVMGRNILLQEMCRIIPHQI